MWALKQSSKPNAHRDGRMQRRKLEVCNYKEGVRVVMTVRMRVMVRMVVRNGGENGGENDSWDKCKPTGRINVR